MRTRDFSRASRFGVGLFALIAAVSSQADTNSWIKPTSGDWHEITSWSLGILPNSSQSVAITNSGQKTVEINSDTTQNYAAALTLNDLTITGTNTLLLDNFGTNAPLLIITDSNRVHEINGLLVGKGSTILNIESALAVESGFIGVAGGRIIQSGGSFRSPNYAMFLYSGGSYYLTNGTFEGFWVDLVDSQTFNLVGSTVRLGHLSCENGNINISGCDLVVSNDSILSGQHSSVSLVQEGGTNRISSLSMSGPVVGGSPVNYSMNSGLLYTSNAVVGPRGTFSQNGGVHIVTNTLQLIGDGRYFAPVTPYFATYGCSGSLSARFIQMNEFSRLFIDGTITISESLQFNGSRYYVGRLSISGMLACSNVLSAGAVVDIEQTGGTFIVTNLFSFAGHYFGGYNGFGARFAKYNFSAGTLMASNIELTAEMVIGSSVQTGRVANPGYFKVAGTLVVGDANEQLGRFILASNSTINLGDGGAKLSFANSSAENWNGAMKLIVTNWNGSPTGGGDDQLKFGSDAFGLTAAQINQIQFANPAGFPPGTYPAQILNTGEIVPAPRPTLSFTKNGTNFVLIWTGTISLQTATNVIGPYEDLAGASSPYTNDMQSFERYFRLRQ